jgi:electron transfer flavoprotein beta subunit
MKILVCIKEVPEPSSELSINSDQTWVEAGDSTEYRMNRFDEYALEEALLIKESFSDVVVDTISVGPPEVKDTLKRALGKGADHAVHILYPDSQQTNSRCMDAFTVSSLIAGYAASETYDLILAGVMAEDDMQCMVGPLIAANLTIPCAVSVVKERLNTKEHTITVDSEMEGGMSESVVLSLPALLTIQSGINQPRYPSLSNMLRSKSQEIATMDPEFFSPLNTNGYDFSVSFPDKSSNCIMIDGGSDNKADTLFAMLRDKLFLK